MHSHVESLNVVSRVGVTRAAVGQGGRAREPVILTLRNEKKKKKVKKETQKYQ